MVIRFHCASCSQPIEVDAEWALKAVSCPYCRKTVTAPVESQIDDLSRIPTAAPAVKTGMPEAAGRTSLSPDPQFDPAPVVGGAQRNGPAMAAFILACALLACALSIVVLFRAHSDEMHAIQQQTEKLLAQGKGVFESTQQPLLDQFGGQPPPWFLAASGLYLMSLAFWVSALVCAIIGLRRFYRRHLAIAAMAILVIVPLFLCCGGPLWM